MAASLLAATGALLALFALVPMAVSYEVLDGSGAPKDVCVGLLFVWVLLGSGSLWATVVLSLLSPREVCCR